MKTTEIIDGIPVVIDWTFTEVIDRLQHNWVEWIIEGEGDDGELYGGNCQADPWHPYDFHSDPENIEKI